MYTYNYAQRGNNIYVSLLWIYNFFTSITSYLYKKISKVFLHFITGYSEVYRIVNKDVFSSKMTIQLLYSILDSKSLENTKRYLNQNTEYNEDQVVQTLFNEKPIQFKNSQDENRILNNLKDCFIQLNGRNTIMRITLNLKQTVYNPENSDHEFLLLNLWNELKPNSPLRSRKSTQWSEIGFQGEDPMTDFRGMGMLGLQNLYYMSKYHKEDVFECLKYNDITRGGYPFAITGIQITELLQEHQLDPLFFNIGTSTDRETQVLIQYQEFFCRIYIQFHQLWIQRHPQTLLDFPQIFHDFEIQIRNEIHNQMF